MRRVSTVLLLSTAACSSYTLIPASAEQKIIVSSSDGGRLMRYEYPSGVAIDHFVGTAISPLDGPAEMVFAPNPRPESGDPDLYVVSYANSSVIRYDGASGQFRQVVVASGAGGLYHPLGIAYRAADSRLYVSSFGNSCVISYHLDGSAPVTVVAQGTGGLSGPSDADFGPDGLLYVSSYSTDSVKVYNPATGAYLFDAISPGQAGLDGSRALKFDAAGNLFVAGEHCDCVVVRNAQTGVVSSAIPSSPLIAWPHGLEFDEAGKLLVVRQFNIGRVQRYDVSSLPAVFLGTVVGPDANLIGIYPFSIAFQPAQPVPCPSDITGDGLINQSDLGLLLSQFGSRCP